MDGAVAIAQQQQQAAVLPRLRDELRLIPADANIDGSPAWMIQDPVSNRFYRIGWMDFEILVRWSLAVPDAIARSVNDETTLNVEAAHVLSLGTFLKQHGLLRAANAADVDSLRRLAAARVRGAGEWLLHHYLFFRVPLLRPQDRLARLMPHVGWLFTPAMLAAVLAAAAAGLVLVLHQWDTFTGSFVDHLTWQGAAGFAVAVAFAKMLHELGHALTATRFGVRVAHMGVAMVVLFPMLYTDTSESWKLTSPRQRLAIASAGILTELALAGVATLLWSLAPDGSFRTAMFFLATTSWLLTVAVNASPFMRFDGYFIVCDLLNFPNLHERAGAFARVWLRRVLPGIVQPWPEELPPHARRWLAAFALTTWVYRFFVFLGIAVVVYMYFFKLLGIALLMVEVGWFIARPIYSELKEWWKRRDEIRISRKTMAAAGVVIVLMVLAIPWRAGIHGAGVVRAERQQPVFAPQAGKLAALPQHSQVSEGELLFSLDAPDVRSGQQRAQVLADARALELVGLSGLKDGEERRASLQSERDRFLAEAGVFSGEHSRMQLTAPFAGRLLDVDPELHAGVWVQPRRPLAILVDPRSWIAEVFVPEEDVARIHAGDDAHVHCGTHEIDGKVQEIDTSRTGTLPYAMLDATSGGPIATVPSTDEHRSEHVARDGIFRVRIALAEAPPQLRMTLCRAVISGSRSSPLLGILDHALSVVIRESGF